MLQIERSAWALTIFSAILQMVIFPLPNFYPLSWIAVAPLLIALLQARRPVTLQFEGNVKLLPARPLQGFLLGYVCGICWYAGNCYWVYNTMKQYGGINAAGAAGLLVLFSLYLALYHGLFGIVIAVLARRSLRTALIAAPFVWVAVELARTRISGFPWDLLGISQVDNLPLAQIARITGVYGVSFEVMVVNVAFAAAFLVHRSRRNSLLVASVAAAFVLQIARWTPFAPTPADHTAVLVQANIPILDSSDWTPQYFRETLADLVKVSEQLPAAERTLKPDFIVWPESPAPFYDGDAFFKSTLDQLASSTGAWVVAGDIATESLGTSSPETAKIYNSAALVSPDEGWQGRYDKVHLVPFGEYVPFKQWLSFAGGLTKEVGDFSRGTSRAPLPAGDKRLGIFICYESIFPDEVRQFAKQGAQIFVNISNDGWYGDSGAYAQHLKQARMRAIENDRWLLRDTNTGVTASIDPYGRVVASVPRKIRTALLAPYAVMDSTTFYTRHGDWLAYACAIISIGAIVMSLTPAKGRRTA